MQPRIEHVSDTALLVAACRALETEQPNGLVRDPFAAQLAGERGMALAKSVPNVLWMQFGMGIRSHFIDELLGIAIRGGVKTVLNLGAGLDTRPWRLDLPSELRWIEVDFPAMLEYKAGALANVQPRCRLEQVSANVNDAAQRASVLQDAAKDGDGLLMTEGLLMYLPAVTVEALAMEAHAAGAFPFWLLDVSSPELMERAHGVLMDNINRVRDESHLDGTEIRALVERRGWSALERRTYITDGGRVGWVRITEIMAAGGQLDPKAPPPADDGSGVWLYQPRP